MGCLQIRIGFIIRMSDPIIGQADNLMIGLGQPAKLGADIDAIITRARAVFIDIVAQMQDNIDPF